MAYVQRNVDGICSAEMLDKSGTENYNDHNFSS